MRLISLSFFICLSLGIQAQNLFIDSLRVFNLEEDKGPFATQNDEIVIINAVYSSEQDSVFSWRASPILELSDSAKSKVLDFHNTLSEEDVLYVLIAFIEIDSEYTEEEISTIVFESFSEYRDHPLTLCKEKIRLALKDDDLLDFRLLSINDLEKLEDKITNKGMHLFNRYHYEIYFHLEEKF